MNKKIQFALVGCGRIGYRHAELIHKLGILTAVCDIDKAKASALAALYSVPFYTGISDMLQQEPAIDVVVICTPNGLHAEHSIVALQAGKHVLCEKPMAIKTADCKAMIAAAENNNRLLFVVKQNRFNPPVVAVKQALEQNVFGKIYSVQLNCFWNRDAAYYSNSWKGTMDMDGGTLFTQFSHFIDLLYWMIGDVEQVRALTGNLAHQGLIDFEDTGVVALQFENGALGTLHFTVNAFQKNMEGSLTIFAEKGTVKIGGQYLNELEYQCIDGYKITDLPKGSPSNNYGTYHGSMSNHDRVYTNVLEVLTENKAIHTPACDALKTVEIIHKIYNAAQFNANEA